MFTKRKPLAPLYNCTVTIGADPEFFLTRNKKIIGSEKVIPKEGITVNTSPDCKIVIDGVQAELNPRAFACRAYLGNEISACFKALDKELKKKRNVKVDFSQLISISDKELKSLDKKSRQFGCAPSSSAYDKKSEIAIKDASKYPYRAAGGHIHIGPNQYQEVSNAIKTPERLARMYDIIVGNTCVLIDRDPGNIERRKVYGKAGEFRTPKHGIEYRTPSNFWLRDYVLMSFVTGLMRFATSIVARSTETNDYEKAILAKVNMRRITKAINENNLRLAKLNFHRIIPILKEITRSAYNDDPWRDSETHTLGCANIDEFLYFAQKGLDHWFKDDPMKHWINLPEGHGHGWESFVKTTIRPEMLRAKKK